MNLKTTVRILSKVIILKGLRFKLHDNDTEILVKGADFPKDMGLML